MVTGFFFFSQWPSRLPPILFNQQPQCVSASIKPRLPSEGGVVSHQSASMWVEPVQWHGWRGAQVAAAAQVDALCPGRVRIAVTDDGVALAVWMVVSATIVVGTLLVLLPSAGTPGSTQDLHTTECVNLIWSKHQFKLVNGQNKVACSLLGIWLDVATYNATLNVRNTWLGISCVSY